MTDIFSDYQPSLQSPASYVEMVTPNDSQDLTTFGRALNVATTGTVRLTTVKGDVATVFVAAGIVFPVRARRVWATGTTATDIAVLY